MDLIGDSELIFRGTVTELTDGVENGEPYSQVTVQVSEALRGQFGEEYAFHQFGLLKPRKMENGKTSIPLRHFPAHRLTKTCPPQGSAILHVVESSRRATLFIPISWDIKDDVMVSRFVPALIDT